MSDVSTVFSGRLSWGQRWRALVARHVWMTALIVVGAALAAFAYARWQSPLYEATAVVLVQAGNPTDQVAAHMLSRDALLSIAARHGLGATGVGRDQMAVALRQAISINALTAVATGYPVQIAGLVISVRLSDAEMSARIANDLAQQILDLGNTGQFGDTQTDLEFYRRDEMRLWQEVSALRAEQDQARAASRVGAEDAGLVDQRQLMLMQDQYDLVRQHLAETEIAARLARQHQAGQFSLLRRATAGSAAKIVQDWTLSAIASGLLLAVALAILRDRRFPAQPSRPWPGSAALCDLGRRVYRQFDDPARPVLGVPRYMVTSVLVVMWLSIAARLLS